jgi:hypothetical protein
VADRLLHDDPPEDWHELEALLEHGVDAHEAQHAVGRRFVEALIAEFGPPPPRLEPQRRSSDERRSRDRRKAQRAARRRNRR